MPQEQYQYQVAGLAYMREFRATQARLDGSALARGDLTTLIQNLRGIVLPQARDVNSPYDHIAITQEEFPQEYAAMRQIVNVVILQQIGMYDVAREHRTNKFSLQKRGAPDRVGERNQFSQATIGMRNAVRQLAFTANILTTEGRNTFSYPARERLAQALSFITDVVYTAIKDTRQFADPLMILADHPASIANIVRRETDRLEPTSIAPNFNAALYGIEEARPAGYEQTDVTRQTGAPAPAEGKGRMGRERRRTTQRVPRLPTPPSGEEA